MSNYMYVLKLNGGGGGNDKKKPNKKTQQNQNIALTI